jgi:hypothetical protein
MDVRQATLQAPATNTTQNYTVSGFGAPQAAIILSCLGNDGAWKNDASIGLGFWDGTNQNVTGCGWDNASDPGNSRGRQYSDASNVVWTIYNSPSSNKRKASITDTVTDGVELTWTGTDIDERPRVTVILIRGINGAQTGHRTADKSIDGTTQTVTAGMTPKLVILAGRRSDTATGQGSTASWFHGFACDNGSSIDQGVVGWRNSDGDPTDCNGQVNDGYCIVGDVGTFGQLSGPIEMTTMTSGSFTTTTRLSIPVFSSHHYLALDFDEDVVGWDAATPTSAGDFDPFTASFTPQWAFMFPTGFQVLDTSYSGGDDGVEAMGLYSVNDDGEEDGHYVTMENGSTGAGSMFGQSRRDTRFEINEVAASASANLVNGDSPTFDATGIVYSDANFSHDGNQHQVLGFFVAASADTGGIQAQAMHNYRHNGRII